MPWAISLSRLMSRGSRFIFNTMRSTAGAKKTMTQQRPWGLAMWSIPIDGSTNNRIGRLQEVNDSSGTTAFYYDLLGRVIRTDKEVDSTTYTTQTTYDGLGRVLDLTYPQNSGTITHTYNGPQLASVQEGSTTYVSYSGFNALGQPDGVTYDNGVTTDYTYDPLNFRLTTLKTDKGSTVLQDLVYAFDDVGNVTGLTDTIHGNQTFAYDELNRLKQASGPAHPTPIDYSYNEIGNMLNNSKVGTYSYPASGSAHPHAVTSDGTHTYTYDDNGNMKTGAGREIHYDVENRPITITTSSSSGSGGGGTPAEDWEVDVGTRVGGNDLYDGSPLGGGTLTDTVSGLPSNGHPVYVRLKSKVAGTWTAVDYSYTATGSSSGPLMTSPSIGSILPSALPTFTWDPQGTIVDNWLIEIKEGGQNVNLYDSGLIDSQATSHTVTQPLPTDGRDLRVRLWTLINSTWDYMEFPYVSAEGTNASNGQGVMSSPTPGTTLSGTSVTFDWTDSGSGGSGGGGGGGNSITTTFVYDGDGGRVKKTVDDGTVVTETTYIGKLYVCSGPTPLQCAKMIFAGGQRIASKQVTNSSSSDSDASLSHIPIPLDQASPWS